MQESKLWRVVGGNYTTCGLPSDDLIIREVGTTSLLQKINIMIIYIYIYIYKNQSDEENVTLSLAQMLVPSFIIGSERINVCADLFINFIFFWFLFGLKLYLFRRILFV